MDTLRYTPVTHVVRHTYTPENGRRGLQFVWYQGGDSIAVHRPATAGGWEAAAFTRMEGPVSADTLPAVCDAWADQHAEIPTLDISQR